MEQWAAGLRLRQGLVVDWRPRQRHGLEASNARWVAAGDLERWSQSGTVRASAWKAPESGAEVFGSTCGPREGELGWKQPDARAVGNTGPDGAPTLQSGPCLSLLSLNHTA